MIGVIFILGSETIEVRIQDSSVFFRTSGLTQFADISGLKLDKVGTVKEFPDLKNNKEWRSEAIKRFKEKIKNMKSETERMKYVIKDLSKHGYVAKYIQRAGHRPVKIN